MGITVGGTLRVTVSTTLITTTLPLVGPDGSAGAPAFSFSGDTNTGIYRTTTDTLGIATGGTLRLSVSTSAVISTLAYHAPTGLGATVPAFTFDGDTNTGLSYEGADNFNLVAGGNKVIQILSSGLAKFPYPPIIAASTPASASAAGTAGQFAYDSNYLYIAVGTNTWKRVAISSW